MRGPCCRPSKSNGGREIRGLFLRFAWRFAESKHRADSPDEPQWSNQQIHRIPEEGGLITFDRMTHELQNPTDDEHRQRPAPVEEEQWQRQDDHRDADAVREPVHRMLVLGFVIGQEILRHSRFDFRAKDL